MGGWLWPATASGFIAFIVLDGLGAAASYATGRAFAASWSAVAGLVPAVLVLAAAIRFLHYALFLEPLLSLQFYLVDLVVMAVAASFGYRLTRVKQMATQYSWAYVKDGLGWRPRSSAGA
jgi:hypothetical protein